MKEIMERCAYCDQPIWHHGDEVPAADDDEAWAALAAQHAEGCEWVKTRAHRMELLTCSICARVLPRAVDETDPGWDEITIDVAGVVGIIPQAICGQCLEEALDAAENE